MLPVCIGLRVVGPGVTAARRDPEGDWVARRAVEFQSARERRGGVLVVAAMDQQQGARRDTGNVLDGVAYAPVTIIRRSVTRINSSCPG